MESTLGLNHDWCIGSDAGVQRVRYHCGLRMRVAWWQSPQVIFMIAPVWKYFDEEANKCNQTQEGEYRNSNTTHFLYFFVINKNMDLCGSTQWLTLNVEFSINRLALLQVSKFTIHHPISVSKAFLNSWRKSPRNGIVADPNFETHTGRKFGDMKD